MLALKKINNNAVICKDNGGQEMIAMGRGIGFGTLPREISLEEIDRTFYDVSPRYVEVMKNLPTEVVMLSGEIINAAKGDLPYELSPNAVFTLADHIEFALERARKKIYVHMPLAFDVEQMYPKEYRIGEYALRKIQKKFGIRLSKNEVTGIALNLLNSKAAEESGSGSEFSDEEMLEDITELIEDDLHVLVDRTTFSYSRYATHLQYLFDRIHKGEALNTDNLQIFASVWEEYPEVVSCVENISRHISQAWNCEVTEEEKLYLILHVNRVCMKEGL
jgi:beta-glucoside operon transcriptional antiterminator